MGRLPIREKLDKRGIDIPLLLHLVCALEVEQLSHLFFRCEVAARTWNAMLEFYI